MRSSALIALLPLLATGYARPHDADSGRNGHHRHSLRKSLGFGPVHKHASFESVPLAPLSDVEVLGLVETDPVEVAKDFIQRQVGQEFGEGFYIREDTYTDRTTGVTHVYARQLIAGLEVGDGDINVNVDRHGRIISWGNSFHPDPAGASTDLKPSTETAKLCQGLQESMDAHRALINENKGDEGVWAMVKSAAQIVLPGVISPPKAAGLAKTDMHKLYKQMRHYKHHHEAICQTSISDFNPVDPVDALVSLLPRITTNLGPVNGADFVAHSEPSLVAKPAYSEPPTQHISGPGLAKAGVKGPVPARLMWTQTSDQPRMVWKMEVEMQDNWYEAYVDAASGDLHRIVDWAKDYTWGSRSEKQEQQVEVQKGGKQKPLPIPHKKYKPYTYAVFPWGVNDPTVGNFTTVTEPWDTTASPLGWHTIPTSANPWTAKLPGMHVSKNETVFHTTAGNNVIAHEDWEGQNNYLLNYRPVNDSMVFVYDYGEYEGLAPKEYIDMVVTQLFYTSNMYHDLLYRLGFDELAGNFQAHNFGLGGRGGDPVTCNAQDGSGYNNANFMTPPDGQAPRMRMYVWDTATPYRDGDVEAGIVIHEYSHGLSTRLTGGPANSGCLGFGEAGGMGEGWGDAIATLIRQIEEHKNFSNGTDIFSMGAWAANRDAGIRNYKYSTNSTSNPSTYKTLDKPGYWGVHAIGEVWAEILFVMSQRLVEKYGFSKTLFPPTDLAKPNDYYTQTSTESVDAAGKPVPLVPKHGNTLALQLIISAMKIQPCRPSFFDARDAIIQADQILTGGDNACLIWKAFAERGLGQDARVIGQTPWGGGVRQDGFKVPVKACEDEKPKH